VKTLHKKKKKQEQKEKKGLPVNGKRELEKGEKQKVKGPLFIQKNAILEREKRGKTAGQGGGRVRGGATARWVWYHRQCTQRNLVG